MILGIAALIATDLAGMAVPWLIKGGVDAVVNREKNLSGVLQYPLWILGAAILQGIFRYLWRVNIHGFSRRAEADLRSAVFSHLTRLPVSYFQRRKTGDLMSRLTNDIQAVRELMGFGSLAVIDAAVVITFSLAFMIAIDPWLTLWSLLVMPLITVAVKFFGRHIFRWSHNVQEQLSDLSAYVQENLAGMRVVQAYAQEENQIQGFKRISAEYLSRNLWLATLWGVFWPLMKVVAGVAAAVVLWLGGRQVMDGSMTLGEFVAFNGYLAMLTWPLMAVGHVVNQYQRGTAALGRIWEILSTPEAPAYLKEPSSTAPGPLRGDIEFRNLHFAYDDRGPEVLKGVSLTIPAGQTCGIIGELGSGKSTLIHLLCRLFEPPQGSVFIDGRDITEIPLAALRASIGLVAQDIFLFSGTIRDNVLYGCRDSNGESLEEAARAAQLLPTVEQFALKFDTLLGERGVRLSGGQKQRTALARAVAQNPPVLILDDAFSSVDTETEDQILGRLGAFIEGRTTLIISHRISTVQRSNTILYMRNGEIVERGNHEELLAKRGAYHRLYQKQRLVREVEQVAHAEGSK